MISRRYVRHLLADGFDDPRRLVSHHGGQRRGVVAHQVVMIRSADTYGDRPDQDLARGGHIDNDIFDSEPARY